MCVAAALDATWILEQPKTSLMHAHKCMQHLRMLGETLPWTSWHRIETWMGAFGTDTMKPTYLISNKRWVKSLTRSKPAGSGAVQVVHKETRADGSKAITGMGKVLKATQAYSWEFGEAVLDGFVFNAAEEDGAAPINSDEPVDIGSVSPSLWDDAELGTVMEFVQG